MEKLARRRGKKLEKMTAEEEAQRKAELKDHMRGL